MDEKKILIVNLSKGRVGEGNANLIGSMLITKIYLAAMSRADKNEAELAKLPNFYLYVDEFQSFANKSFADILSEARKYKLNLTIAHQYIEQMEEEVRDAVFGNVGTMVTFRVGAFDSEVLEKEFAPTFMAVDLVNLGFAQVYLKLMIDGVSSQPFSATTMAPIAKSEINFKDAVIKSSREQFAIPRVVVEKNIIDWHDAGTSREAKPQAKASQSQPPVNATPKNNQQNNLESRRDDHPRKEFPIRQEVSMDEAKKAFMKAAEELRQKDFMKESQKREEKERVLVNDSKKEKELATQSGKKNPSKENLSSLKDALASVIKKPQEEVEFGHKEEVKHNSKPNSSTSEIPEDVLRNLLE